MTSFGGRLLAVSLRLLAWSLRIVVSMDVPGGLALVVRAAVAWDKRLDSVMLETKHECVMHRIP